MKTSMGFKIAIGAIIGVIVGAFAWLTFVVLPVPGLAQIFGILGLIFITEPLALYLINDVGLFPGDSIGGIFILTLLFSVIIYAIYGMIIAWWIGRRRLKRQV
tara:strand:+ start:1882 stop:2190 length:309 start_codon:yes stop_codon:yes gene_type:complete